MNKGRLEAFTDAVIAIILTILVLELQPPHSGSLASLWQLRGVFAIYLVSFLTLIVYWNNHHHLFQLVERIDWRVMWANSFFMLVVSMFPFATSWVGEGHVGTFGPVIGLWVCDLDGQYQLCAISTNPDSRQWTNIGISRLISSAAQLESSGLRRDCTCCDVIGFALAAVDDHTRLIDVAAMGDSGSAH